MSTNLCMPQGLSSHLFRHIAESLVLCRSAVLGFEPSRRPHEHQIVHASGTLVTPVQAYS